MQPQELDASARPPRARRRARSQSAPKRRLAARAPRGARARSARGWPRRPRGARARRARSRARVRNFRELLAALDALGDEPARREREAHDVVGLHLALPERRRGPRGTRSSERTISSTWYFTPFQSSRGVRKPRSTSTLPKRIGGAKQRSASRSWSRFEDAGAQQALAEPVDHLVRGREDDLAAVEPDRLRVVAVREVGEPRLPGPLDPGEDLLRGEAGEVGRPPRARSGSSVGRPVAGRVMARPSGGLFDAERGPLEGDRARKGPPVRSLAPRLRSSCARRECDEEGGRREHHGDGPRGPRFLAGAATARARPGGAPGAALDDRSRDGSAHGPALLPRLARGVSPTSRRGGLFIKTRDPISPGRRVLIEMHFPDGSPLEAVGRIAWSKRVLAPVGSGAEDDGVGVEILGAPPDQLATLELLPRQGSFRRGIAPGPWPGGMLTAVKVSGSYRIASRRSYEQSLHPALRSARRAQRILDSLRVELVGRGRLAPRAPHPLRAGRGVPARVRAARARLPAHDAPRPRLPRGADGDRRSPAPHRGPGLLTLRARGAALGALLLALAACGPVPGGTLAGADAPVPADWAPKLGGDKAFCEIESRPADPHSIQLECFLLDGKLYVNSHRFVRASWWPVESWALDLARAARREGAHRRRDLRADRGPGQRRRRARRGAAPPRLRPAARGHPRLPLRAARRLKRRRWCPGQGSNLHGLAGQAILSRPRLPISPPGPGAKTRAPPAGRLATASTGCHSRASSCAALRTLELSSHRSSARAAPRCAAGGSRSSRRGSLLVLYLVGPYAPWRLPGEPPPIPQPGQSRIHTILSALGWAARAERGARRAPPRDVALVGARERRSPAAPARRARIALRGAEIALLAAACVLAGALRWHARARRRLVGRGLDAAPRDRRQARARSGRPGAARVRARALDEHALVLPQADQPRALQLRGALSASTAGALATRAPPPGLGRVRAALPRLRGRARSRSRCSALLVHDLGFPRAAPAAAFLLAIHPVARPLRRGRPRLLVHGALHDRSRAWCLLHALRDGRWRWWLGYAASQPGAALGAPARSTSRSR